MAGVGLSKSQKTFDPGLLIERVRFETRAAVSDGAGNVVGDYDPATAIDCRALFLMRPGSETVITARISGLQPVDVVIRRSRQTLAITAAWRLTDLGTGDIYAITGPPADMDRSRQFLTIPCVQGKAA